VQRRRQQPEDADQAIVPTPYGRGLVVRTRKSDGIREVRLLEWGGGGGGGEEPSCGGEYHGVAYNGLRGGRRRERPAATAKMMYASSDFPSPTPRVGDDVVCQFGRGRVMRVLRASPHRDESNDTRDNDDDNDGEGKTLVVTRRYTIALTSWRLDGGRDDDEIDVASGVFRRAHKVVIDMSTATACDDGNSPRRQQRLTTTSRRRSRCLCRRARGGAGIAVLPRCYKRGMDTTFCKLNMY